MNLLNRSSRLALAAVVDVTLHSRARPVNAKALAARHHLPPRHLESLLQKLVHAKILKGTRGPLGGYELARERRLITAGEIVRIASSLSTSSATEPAAHSRLFKLVVEPSVTKAGEAFLTRLDTVTIEQLCAAADEALILADEGASAFDERRRALL
jgi:Rrf2 family protein